MAAKASPRTFRVLDWPALREAFERHDALANSAKGQFNRRGGRGARLGAIGASLLALAPLANSASAIESLLVIAGCALVLVGGLMALWHLRSHSGRARWLLNRVWTERLRQFYFQFVINNFDAAVAAMNDDAALGAYRLSRDGALWAFLDEMEQNLSARSFTEAVRWLADDHEDARTWAQSMWQVDHTAAARADADQRDLLEGLARRRIGVQEIYARLNLKPAGSSQANRARQIGLYGNTATFAFILFLSLAGALIILQKIQENLPADILIALSGVAAAWGLYFRLVDQGMGYSLDAERYELYFEQVGLVRQSFDAAGDEVHGKIAALRRLEIYSYREMRQFLRVHLRSRFLG